RDCHGLTSLRAPSRGRTRRGRRGRPPIGTSRPPLQPLRQLRELRARIALNRLAVTEDRVVEVERGELLDRLALLLRVYVVACVHGPESGLVVRGVAGNEQRTGLVQER